ncbi:MAG: TolC family protein, partial [Bacteroidales bacterium]
MSRIHTLKLSVFILLFFVVYTTKAQEEQPLSLKNAIGISLENNFGITIQEQQVAISQRQNNWGAAGALPTVTFVGEGGVSQSMDSDLEKTSTTQRASA